MKPQERESFATMLEGLSQVYGNNLGIEGMSIWWAALAPYSIDQVRGALSDHVTDPTTGKFAPKPSDVIGKIQQNDGHLGAEAAWALVSKAIADEDATVVWTDPIKDAFFIALPLADDPIAARMAFKESYTKAVAMAREAAVPITWIASLGHDPAGREPVLLEAVRQGRLTAEHIKALLPGIAVPLLEGLEIKRIEATA